MRFRLLASTAVVSVALSIACHAADSPTLLRLATDPMLDAALYRTYNTAPESRVKFDPQSYAVGVNINWQNAPEADRANLKWFVEQQAYGADMVQAGIVTKNPATAALGWKILDWGFAHQGQDGGFTGTGDAYHSTSFFLEGAARSLLLSREANTADAAERLKTDLPKVESAARWMLGPARTPGEKFGAPYTHRRFLVAAGLAETAALTTDPDFKKQLTTAAADLVREGIGLQTPDGTLPEKGGFDPNYQAVSALFAARLVSVLPEPELRTQLITCIDRALARDAQAVEPDGSISVAGSTRTANEVGRSGQPKKLDYRTWAQAYVYGAELTGKAEYREIARRTLVQNRWLESN